MTDWATDLAVQAAARAGDLPVWSWLYDRLGFDPCHPALWDGGIFPGAVRGGDVNAREWQMTGLPRGLARQADRAIVTLPVFVDGAAADIFALDPLEPLYHRHLTGLVPVLPVGLGGAFFPVPDRIRLHGSLLNWLRGVARDLIDGRARDIQDTGRVWVGDWRSIDAMHLRAAIGLGRTEAACDSDRHALALRDMLRPPLPKPKLMVAA